MTCETPCIKGSKSTNTAIFDLVNYLPETFTTFGKCFNGDVYLGSKVVYRQADYYLHNISYRIKGRFLDQSLKKVLNKNEFTFIRSYIVHFNMIADRWANGQKDHNHWQHVFEYHTTYYNKKNLCLERTTCLLEAQKPQTEVADLVTGFYWAH